MKQRTACIFAAALAVGASPTGAAVAAERAGVAAAVVGDVTVTGEPRPDPVSAQTGTDMLRFDHVASADESRIQVLLRDETTFTLGENSEITIDEFVYDPESGVGEIGATYVKGVFRYVSGKASEAASDNVEIKTELGTIGVRGTQIFVMPNRDGAGLFVGLLGPGPRNNAALRAGGFDFTNEYGTTTVRRSGYGVQVLPGQAPGPAVEIPVNQLQSLRQSVRPAAAAAQAGDGGAQSAQAVGDVQQASGQATAETRSSSAMQAEVTQALTQADDSGSDAAADAESDQLARDMDDMMDDGGGDLNGNVDVALDTFVQMQWTPDTSTVSDLDLHVTGPTQQGGERFHVYFNQRGSLETAPFVALDNDRVGQGVGGTGSEVVTIGQFFDGAYRASVFNFGDSNNPESVSLANESNVVLELIQNGAISRGPEGSAIIDGDVLRRLTPQAGDAGNTWVGFEIDGSSGAVTEINDVVFTEGGSAAVQ